MKIFITFLSFLTFSGPYFKINQKVSIENNISQSILILYLGIHGLHSHPSISKERVLKMSEKIFKKENRDLKYILKNLRYLKFEKDILDVLDKTSIEYSQCKTNSGLEEINQMGVHQLTSVFMRYHKEYQLDYQEMANKFHKIANKIKNDNILITTDPIINSFNRIY